MIRKLIGKIFGIKSESGKTPTHKSSPASEKRHPKGESRHSGEKPSGRRSNDSRPRRQSDHDPRRHERFEGEGSSGPSRGGRNDRSRGGARREGGRGPRRESGGGEYRPSRSPERPPREEAYEGPAKSAAPVEPAPEFNPEHAFAKLGLAPNVVQAVQASGYENPTPIQEQSIPVIVSGKDMIGCAQTGTGKTAAFALPILTMLGEHQHKTRVLVLSPTRELAIQVGEAFIEYGKYTPLKHAVIYGGVGYGKQREDLAADADIIVATPGRLLDFISQGEIDLSSVTHLVIDEADRMLDMGFIPDVKRIIGECPRSRQTLLFSATIPPAIDSLAGFALKDPQRISVTPPSSTASTVAQYLYPVARDQKNELLKAILEKIQYKSVIIFTRTKMGADRIAAGLAEAQHTVTVLHSDRSQRERIEAITGFKEGTYEVLVATDIAARGLDIEGVSHVINFDVPENPEDYVHRIGRTGRALAVGDALTLFTVDDMPYVGAIEMLIGKKIPREKLPDFKYSYTVLLDSRAMKQRWG
ncbi:MAG: DEAD/DEAH box helicase [Verrucomicrobiae bacterium]|nr:DEAD/DEAH box helicase [Verrucomicrobiae bacterium]